MMISVTATKTLCLFLWILHLSPPKSPEGWDLRWASAEGIAAATDNPKEQEVLVRIGAYESGYATDVATCRRKGTDYPSLGLFQIVPQTKLDAIEACGSPAKQAAVAIRYVRMSAKACPNNVGADSLAMYVSGTCARGIPEARLRWGAP